MFEQLKQQIKRRTLVIRIFPNEQSCLRLFRALAMQNTADLDTQFLYVEEKGRKANTFTAPRPPPPDRLAPLPVMQRATPSIPLVCSLAHPRHQGFPRTPPAGPRVTLSGCHAPCSRLRRRTPRASPPESARHLLPRLLSSPTSCKPKPRIKPT